MPVPYGLGVGDFLAVGTLAWNVYKSCKVAPGNFKNISIEVLSLHAVLKEGEEKLAIHTLPTTKAERLKLIKEGCEKVLIDLQSLVDKYESLGTQSKRTSDRIRWGNEDLAEIRARLTSNISMLTAFTISNTQASVETKLDKLIQEFCRGNREPPTVSFQTVDSLSADDRAVWRTIRKELEDIGISLAVFNANRNFIFDWFIHAVETGAFKEQRIHVIDDESNCSDGRKPLSREEHGEHETGRQIEHSHIGSLGSANEEKPPARQRSSQSAHDLDLSPPRSGPKTFDYVFVSTQITPKDKRRIPRAAALLAEVSRPRQRLIKAVKTRDVSKALKILKDEASFHLLDSETLDRALWKASRQNGHPSLCLLVSELIARGGNVDYVSSDTNERTPLWNCVNTGCLDTVRILVDNGADVNYTGSDRIAVSGSQSGVASDFSPRAALNQNTTILRFLTTSGVDVNAQYRARVVRGDYYDNYELSLIQEAALLGAFSAIKVLIEQGADVDATSPTMGTALMLALCERQEDAALVLLQNGADPCFKIALNIADLALRRVPYGSPIEAAIVGGKASLVRLLLDWGAVPEDSTVKLATHIAFATENARAGRDGNEDWQLITRIVGL